MDAISSNHPVSSQQNWKLILLLVTAGQTTLIIWKPQQTETILIPQSIASLCSGISTRVVVLLKHEEETLSGLQDNYNVLSGTPTTADDWPRPQLHWAIPPVQFSAGHRHYLGIIILPPTAKSMAAQNFMAHSFPVIIKMSSKVRLLKWHEETIKRVSSCPILINHYNTRVCNLQMVI